MDYLAVFAQFIAGANSRRRQHREEIRSHARLFVSL